MAVTTSHATIEYNGNSSTTAFPTTFQFFAAADLRVIEIDEDDNEVLKTISTHYTVSGGQAANGIPGTGTVTMLIAPESGTTLRIDRATTQTQLTTFANNDAFPAKTVEAAYDRRTLVEQELERDIARSLGGTIGEAAAAAAAAAGSAAAAATSATTSATYATASAVAAGASADSAAEANEDREFVESLVGALPLEASGIYPDTTAGLAAVSEGEYFAVPGSPGSEIFLTLYRDESGVAVAQNSSPSSSIVTEVQNARAADTSLGNRIGNKAARQGINILRFGFLDGGPLNPERVNDSEIVEVPESLTTFHQRGLTHAMLWQDGAEFIRYVPTDEEKEYILSAVGRNSYVCGGWIGHCTDTPHSFAVVRLEGVGDTNITLTSTTHSRVAIGTDTHHYYEFGLMPKPGDAASITDPEDLAAIRIGFPSNAASADYHATGFYLAFRDTAWNVGDLPVLQRCILEEIDRRQIPSTPRLTLNGPSPAQSFIEMKRGAHVIKRGFRMPAPATIILPSLQTPTFSMSSEYIDGTLFRSMTDDNAPYNVNGAHLGGQHGLGGGLITATAHGKDATDIGSIWANDGNQYALLSVVNANQLLLVRRGTIAVPPTGSYTHVSGAAHTGDITATVSEVQIFHPMITNYSMRVTVDGREVTDPLGVFPYDDNVTFAETYDVMDREDVIDYAIAEGAGWETTLTGSPLFTVTNAYVYDQETNLTIYADFIVYQPLTLNHLYGLQVQLSGATEWYIPKTTAFTHDAVTKNFSLIEDATVSLSTDIEFTTANTEAGGLFLDRFYTMTEDHGLAVGFAPIQNAEPTVRRSTYVTGSNIGLTIPTTRKTYFRIKNTGGGAAASYDRYSWVGFRNLFVRNEQRTAAHVVRTNEADFLYVEWHDLDVVDSIPLPADLFGRPFTVVEKSAGVDVLSEHLNGSLRVKVTVPNTYGYLVLRMDR